MADIIITNKINMTNNTFKSSLESYSFLETYSTHLKKKTKKKKVWWPLKILTLCWEQAREPGDVHTIEAAVQSFWHLWSFDEGTFCSVLVSRSGSNLWLAWSVFPVLGRFWVEAGEGELTSSLRPLERRTLQSFVHHRQFPGLVAVVLRSFFI